MGMAVGVVFTPRRSTARVVADRAEAVEYTLGAQSYRAAEIKQEIVVLTQYVFFEYVILSRRDGSLFGVLDAHKLVRILSRQPGPYSWKALPTLPSRLIPTGPRLSTP